MTPPSRRPPQGQDKPGTALRAPSHADGRNLAAAGSTVEPRVVPEHQRSSRDRIYESMMRGGGEPFGAPFTAGLATLTQAVVRKIKQKGFFSFETLERPQGYGDDEAPVPQTNKFTRYGAAPFQGDHADKRKPK